MSSSPTARGGCGSFPFVRRMPALVCVGRCWEGPEMCSGKGFDLAADRAAATKCHKPGGLKQQKWIVSLFWRPEVRNQGVGWAVLPLKPAGATPHLLLAPAGGCSPGVAWLAAAALQSLPHRHVCSPLVCLSLCLFSCEDASHIGFRAHPASV